MEPVDWSLGVGQIIAGALDFGFTVGEFLNTVAPYRALGAPLPELSKEITRELSTWHPERPEEASSVLAPVTDSRC